MGVYTARPTTYLGIDMRSRTEATFAAFLDRHSFTWEYEPRAFATAAEQYLPDFRITIGNHVDAPLYIDVKGTLGNGNVWVAAAAVLRRMRVIWSSEPGAALAVAISDARPKMLMITAANKDKPTPAHFAVCAGCAATGIAWRTTLICQACGLTAPPAARLDPFYRGRGL